MFAWLEYPSVFANHFFFRPESAVDKFSLNERRRVAEAVLAAPFEVLADIAPLVFSLWALQPRHEFHPIIRGILDRMVRSAAG